MGIVWRIGCGPYWSSPGGRTRRSLPTRPRSPHRKRPTASTGWLGSRRLRGRACAACWTVCAPIRILVRQGIEWRGPIDHPQRGVRGTRGGGPRPLATHRPPHPLKIGQGGVVVGAQALIQYPRTSLLVSVNAHPRATYCGGARLPQLHALAASIRSGHHCAERPARSRHGLLHRYESEGAIRREASSGPLGS